MAKRIRYVYTQEPLVLISKQYFIHPKDGSKYQVNLNEGDKTFEVVEDLTGTVVSKSEKAAPNLHITKIKAKEALIALGITFENEKRVVDSKLTPDGN